MKLADVAPIADAILYEGYSLYPYRPSALKNRGGWTFGVVEPGGQLRCECVLEGPPQVELEVKLRFLHPIRRTCDEDPRLSGWEASAREVDVGPLRLVDLAAAASVTRFSFAAEAFVEDALRREQDAVEGVLELTAVRAAEGAHRVTLRVTNLTSQRPDAALCRSLASTHALLGARDGAFVSPRDPSPGLEAAVDACRSAGLWPVLVGAAGARDRVLCAPIILDDHPAVAPESPGDLFDATEIDEILTLRILTLTDEERREAAQVDPRARALLARTEALEPAALARLHGTFRRRARTLRVGDRELGPGDRVRLRPRARADIFDLALAGRAASILSVEEDVDGRTYFTVSVDDDPGRDLAAQGRPGHRFFFGPDEVEALDPEGGA